MDNIRRIRDEEGVEGSVSLDELVREGARWMIAVVLEVEVDEYVSAFTEEVDVNGKRLVVCNGRGKERKLTIGSGTLPIRAPRVNDRRIDSETGECRRFSSGILPVYMRRSPKVTEVLPVLYLRGLLTGDFVSALRDLLGGTLRGYRHLRFNDLPKDGGQSGAVCFFV